MQKAPIKKAMILAAGFGTRLRPLTDNIPKALVESYGGEPMIKHVISKLESAGIEEIVINTHHHADKMKEYFNTNNFAAKITLVHEDEILGTGGAIKNAESELSGVDNFLVYNVDVDSDIDILDITEFHLKQNSLATLAVMDRVSSRYLLVDDSNKIIGRTENGAEKIYAENCIHFKQMAFSGIHILSSGIFSFFPADDNFDIIPVYMDMIAKGGAISAYDMSRFKWKDLGKTVN